MSTKPPDLRVIALRIREIASRVRCLPVPSPRDPEAFHINRSERAHQLDLIAFELWPEGKPPEAAPRRPTPPNTNDLPRSPRRR